MSKEIPKRPSQPSHTSLLYLKTQCIFILIRFQKASREEIAAQPEQFQLNFRPQDIFHKPIQGTVHACKDKLLVKVRVTRPENGSLADSSKVELVEVVGPVKKVVRFRRMSPFQFDVKVPEELASLPEALHALDCTLLLYIPLMLDLAYS